MHANNRLPTVYVDLSSPAAVSPLVGFICTHAYTKTHRGRLQLAPVDGALPVGISDPMCTNTDDDDVVGGGGWFRGLVTSLVGAAVKGIKTVGRKFNDTAVNPCLSRVASMVPQRLRGLTRLSSNIIRDGWGLARSPNGRALWDAGTQVVGSVEMVVASPQERQIIVHTATGMVRIVDALDNPRFKAGAQQGVAMGASGLDTLASQRSHACVEVRSFGRSVRCPAVFFFAS